MSLITKRLERCLGWSSGDETAQPSSKLSGTPKKSEEKACMRSSVIVNYVTS